MGNYSKLIAALIGNLVGITLAYLASRGLATCAVVDQVETCTAFGMSQAQLTGILLALFNTTFVYAFPKNKP